MAKKTAKPKAEEASTKVAKKSGKVKDAQKRTISFDYIKSNQFRVVHADGVHGGLSPRGQAIQMAFFSERQPIPQKETYHLVEGIKLAGLKDTVGRDAIIREVEVEVLMGLETASAIHKWLGEKIELVKKLEKEKSRK